MNSSTLTRLLLLVALVAVSCARRGELVLGETSLSDFTVPSSRERAFDATLSVSQALNLNVAVLEKSSGLLRFENAILSPAQLDSYCIYPYVYQGTGEAFDTFEGWATRAAAERERGFQPVTGSVSLTILLSELSTKETGVSIRGNWTAAGNGQLYRVSSKGILENELKLALLNALQVGNRGNPASPQERLRALQRLREDGLVDKREYDRKKAEILKDF